MIALCDAKEANDLAAMTREIQRGADVNALGRDGMTPLLWAFPENKIERFELLLKNGARSDVPIQSYFTARPFLPIGSTIAHITASCDFPEHFKLVLKYGGDPNQVYFKGQPPNAVEVDLFMSVSSGQGRNKFERCVALIEAGVDRRLLTKTLHYSFVSFGYDITMKLLENGADFRHIDPVYGNLCHVLARAEPGVVAANHPKEREQFDSLVRWVEAQGEDFAGAKKLAEKFFAPRDIDLSKAANIWRAGLMRLKTEQQAKKNLPVQAP